MCISQQWFNREHKPFHSSDCITHYERSPNANTQFIAALAFSSKWTDKLQKEKKTREGQANTTAAL